MKPEPRNPRQQAGEFPAASRRIRVMVAESAALDRAGLVHLLTEAGGFDVVGVAANLADAIVRAGMLAPDVLIVGMRLDGQDEGPAIPALLRAHPRLRILALADRAESECLVLNPPSRAVARPAGARRCEPGMDCLQLAFAQGAAGTLRHTADPMELFAAIRDVLAGGSALDVGTAARIAAAEGVDARKGGLLSAREAGVAALIAEGCSNKEIGTALSISDATVKKHVGHILLKLGLADRLQVGLYLARHPLVLAR